MIYRIAEWDGEQVKLHPQKYNEYGALAAVRKTIELKGREAVILLTEVLLEIEVSVGFPDQKSEVRSQESEGELLTKKQAVEALGGRISEGALNQALWTGACRGQKVKGCWLVRLADVEDYLAKRKRPPGRRQGSRNKVHVERPAEASDLEEHTA